MRCEPLGCARRVDERQQLVEHLAQVADERDVHLDVLVDLGGIDVDVDLLRVGRVGLEVAGDAIVEAHAEGEQQVGFLDGRVDPGFAVHAHHAEVQRMRGGDAAEAEQRHRHRDLRRLGELADTLASRSGQHDAVAGENHRPLGGLISASAFAGSLLRRARDRDGSRRSCGAAASVELARRLLRVLGDVDQHRAGPPGLRDVERLAHRAAQRPRARVTR